MVQIFFIFVSLITAYLLFPTEALCCNEQGVKIFEANLTTGSSNITTASSVVISWLNTLGTNPGSETCNLRGVIRITFPSSLNGKQNCILKFDLHLLKDLSQGNGWNFDIADSTNNGYGGDSGHTSNAAEIHNNRGNFRVYTNTLPGYTDYSKNGLLVDEQTDVMTNDVTITVGDEYVHFNNYRAEYNAATAVHTCFL